MSATRYTRKMLEADVEEFNKVLENKKEEYRFAVRNYTGYTVVDLATPAQLAAHCSSRNLAYGTPRQCLDACRQHMWTLRFTESTEQKSYLYSMDRWAGGIVLIAKNEAEAREKMAHVAPNIYDADVTVVQHEINDSFHFHYYP